MKNDPRIIKTKKAIEDAFIELVELKGYANVKLVDIAKKAKVNRNTIYLHYSSKEEIISSIINNAMFEQSNNIDVSEILKLRNNKFKLEAYFRAIFNMVDKQEGLFRILLLEDQLTGYFNIVIKKIKKIILEKIKNTTRNEINLTFIISGIFNTISDYILNARGNAQETVKIITDLTYTGLRKIQL